ncbi:response regulator [uncultured Psychrosphaera sp.]|jgi:two-component system chemotaxis response regulator CheY|uniref:response regulator n=1 Tax=uncultured Psychrosphaera sp. TaxID=1403522 RepID=UPI002618D68E|nr:response regulator [uncultured Psychrosphaera sp.]
MEIAINILLVDDVEYTRELLRSILLSCLNEQKINMTAKFSHSSTGLDIPQRITDEKINLVYLDIELPTTTGLTVLKQIRRAHPDIMVVMVSGESSADNVTNSIKMGANGFIVKPFNSDRVIDSLKSYIKKEYKI